MRTQPRVVLLRVVAPFGKHLPGEGVPVAVQKRVFLCFVEHCQLAHVLRVVVQQRLVVKDGGGHEDAVLAVLVPGPIRVAHTQRRDDACQGRRGSDKALFYPAVTDAAGVCAGADVDARPRPIRTIAGKQVAVLVPCEVRELVERNVVVGFALIFGAVLCVLHRAEIDLRAGRELPKMLAVVVPRARIGQCVVAQALFDELREVRVGFSEDKALVPRDFDLPQRLSNKCVALAAACGAAIQSLIFRASHESSLFRLWLPNDLTQRRRRLP